MADEPVLGAAAAPPALPPDGTAAAPPALPPDGTAAAPPALPPDGATADAPVVAGAATPARACHACAAQLDSAQRYCLHCGAPVPGLAPELGAPPRPAAAAGAGATATTAVATPARRSDGSLRPLAALGAATLAGAMLTLLLMTALAGKVDQPITVNVPAGKAPVVNVASGAAQPVVEAPFRSDWPGGNAWTVQLQALPKSGATAATVTAAKTAATAAGATAVGALDSDDHPSLTGGLYVVYAGVFTTKAKAEATRKRLRGAFAGAKVVRIAETAATSKATKKKLDDLKSSSGDDYVDKSKKLPDSVQTPGSSTPPADSTSTTPAADPDDVDTIG